MNALKEWATVVNALETGDQTVLLRKGGILEDSSGFVVESEKFFLFPTFEHQETKHLKPQFHKHLEDALANKPKDGRFGTNDVSPTRSILSKVARVTQVLPGR